MINFIIIFSNVSYILILFLFGKEFSTGSNYHLFLSLSSLIYLTFFSSAFYFARNNKNPILSINIFGALMVIFVTVKVLISQNPLSSLPYLFFILNLMLRNHSRFISGGFPFMSILFNLYLYAAYFLSLPITLLPLIYFTIQVFEDIKGIEYKRLNQLFTKERYTTHVAVAILLYIYLFIAEDILSKTIIIAIISIILIFIHHGYKKIQTIGKASPHTPPPSS